MSVRSLAQGLLLSLTLLAALAGASPLRAQGPAELEELTPPQVSDSEPESLPPPVGFGLKLPGEAEETPLLDAPTPATEAKPVPNNENLPGLTPRPLTPFRRERAGTAPAEELGPIQPGQAEELPPFANNAEPIELGEEETIRERYPSGAVKIERVVRQDREGNYVQHGPWKAFDPRGRLIADGTFFHNQRDGVWRRVFFGHESALFQSESLRGFQPPFISEVTFERGRMSGEWSLIDAKARQVFTISLLENRRHGKTAFWSPAGQPVAEIHFEQGEIHGRMTVWNREGRVTMQKEYIHGRTLETKLERYANKQPKSRVAWLSPELKQESQDDWWGARLAEYKPTGKPLKHGPFTAWHENGQLARQGEFDRDLPVGKTTWWHITGQKSVEGEYENGLACGKWTWWFDSGQKQIQGDFDAGVPRGDWLWWDTNGQVARRGPPTSGNSVLAKHPASLNALLQPFAGAISQPQPQSELPKPPPMSFGDKPAVELGAPLEE
jgi:antitoxin component YwqK of YwqJK toxin-antitoxin module